VKEIPLNLILSETDNPGGPKSIYGEIGMPSLIKNVVKVLAKIKNQSLEEMIEIIEYNFLMLIQNDSMLLSKYNTIKTTNKC